MYNKKLQDVRRGWSVKEELGYAGFDTIRTDLGRLPVVEKEEVMGALHPSEFFNDDNKPMTQYYRKVVLVTTGKVPAFDKPTRKFEGGYDVVVKIRSTQKALVYTPRSVYNGQAGYETNPYTAMWAVACNYPKAVSFEYKDWSHQFLSADEEKVTTYASIIWRLMLSGARVKLNDRLQGMSVTLDQMHTPSRGGARPVSPVCLEHYYASMREYLNILQDAKALESEVKLGASMHEHTREVSVKLETWVNMWAPAFGLDSPGPRPSDTDYLAILRWSRQVHQTKDMLTWLHANDFGLDLDWGYCPGCGGPLHMTDFDLVCEHCDTRVSTDWEDAMESWKEDWNI